jgi:hypothetical protein
MIFEVWNGFENGLGIRSGVVGKRNALERVKGLAYHVSSRGVDLQFPTTCTFFPLHYSNHDFISIWNEVYNTRILSESLESN